MLLSLAGIYVDYWDSFQDYDWRWLWGLVIKNWEHEVKDTIGHSGEEPTQLISSADTNKIGDWLKIMLLKNFIGMPSIRYFLIADLFTT